LWVNNVPSRRKVLDDVWWDYYVFITVITKCLMVEFIWNIYFDKNGKKINIHKKTPVNDRHIYKHITASTIRMQYYLVTFELWISFPPLWQKILSLFYRACSFNHKYWMCYYFFKFNYRQSYLLPML
jgi:hypothetical protein